MKWNLNFAIICIITGMLSIFISFPAKGSSRCPKGFRWSKSKIRCIKGRNVRKKKIHRKRKSGKIKVSIQMIKIKSGEFFMGTKKIKSHYGKNAPIHKVIISKPFLISKYEVTRALWTKVMKTTPFGTKLCSGDCPAENISWFDAIKFCNKLSKLKGLSLCYKISPSLEVKWNYKCKGYRLPTEAEWEYSARAGDSNDKIKNIDMYAWHAGNSSILSSTRYLHKVGTRMPNKWGVFDMIGGVFEWVWDKYGKYGTKKIKDPKGATKGLYRIIRGGGYTSKHFTMMYYVREKTAPTWRYKTIGFRVAQSI